ncbi:hypothetical protein ACFLWS_08620 [Chloroflexota bacterium]
MTEVEWRELFIALNLGIHVDQHSEPGSAELCLYSLDVSISYFRGEHDFEELRKRQRDHLKRAGYQIKP